MTKKHSRTLAIAATLWLPLVLFVNPGWMTLFLFTPLGLVAAIPLLVLLADRFKKTPFTLDDTRLRIAFYTSWVLLGIFLVNFSDVPESVGSIFSRLLGAADNRSPLVEISGWLSVAMLITAIGLVSVIFGRALHKRR